MYLLNAFSLSMLPPGDRTVRVRRLTEDTARAMAARYHLAGALVSAVGHADTARLFADALGVPVPCQRATVLLAGEDHEAAALVGQYVGTRLPEGATALPKGARIDWMLVSVCA